MAIHSILDHSNHFLDLSQSYIDTFKNLLRPKIFILHYLDMGSKGLSDPTTPLGPLNSPYKIHSSYTSWFHFSPLYIYLATLTKMNPPFWTHFSSLYICLHTLITNEPYFLNPFQSTSPMSTHINKKWTSLAWPISEPSKWPYTH